MSTCTATSVSVIYDHRESFGMSKDLHSCIDWKWKFLIFLAVASTFTDLQMEWIIRLHFQVIVFYKGVKSIKQII